MYPRDCAQPMREEDLCAGKPEETSVAYAVAKLAGVEMCLAFNRQYGAKRFLPLIPNTLYGPGDNFDPASSHVIPALIRRFHEAKATGAEAVALWGTGAARREAVYVDDAVDAALHVLRSDTGPMTFPMNIGSGEERSIRSLAELVGRIVGYAGDIVFDATKPDGAPRKSLDGSRLAAAGWNGPITPLEEGLRATYTWYRETGGARPPTAAERK
jgi:GDP-L-fucose synthase